MFLGVSALRGLALRAAEEEDAPRLAVLLAEAFCAVFLALLGWATAARDAHLLYRLSAHSPQNADHSRLFGGGVKRLLTTAPAPPQVSHHNRIDSLPVVLLGILKVNYSVTRAKFFVLSSISWTRITSCIISHDIVCPPTVLLSIRLRLNNIRSNLILNPGFPRQFFVFSSTKHLTKCGGSLTVLSAQNMLLEACGKYPAFACGGGGNFICEH